MTQSRDTTEQTQTTQQDTTARTFVTKKESKKPPLNINNKVGVDIASFLKFHFQATQPAGNGEKTGGLETLIKGCMNLFKEPVMTNLNKEDIYKMEMF